MDRDAVIHILRSLGVGGKIKGTGGNILCSCPFASYGGHRRGLDKNPSFSVKIDACGESVWNCFACGRKGTVRGLIYQFEQESGRDFSHLKGYIDERQKKSPYRKLNNASFYTPDRPIESGFRMNGFLGRPKAEPPPRSMLTECSKIYCEYAKKRGISKAQYARFRLGFSKEEWRLFIPIIDHRNIFVGYSMRAVLKTQEPKYKNMFNFYKEEYLYGENLLNRSLRRVFIVEGFADVWRLDRAGIKNVVAKMGTRLSDEQIRKVCEWFDTVILIPDNDPDFYDKNGKFHRSPGLLGVEADEGNLKLRRKDIRVFVAPTLKGVKDVGEYTNEQLKWLIGEIIKMIKTGDRIDEKKRDCEESYQKRT